ncbi:MAG: FecR domain-containing protein [Planctomycetes bacterium]|nr:FecR domain-containing protein [Planctomycetota bacterium]
MSDLFASTESISQNIEEIIELHRNAALNEQQQEQLKTWIIADKNNAKLFMRHMSFDVAMQAAVYGRADRREEGFVSDAYATLTEKAELTLRKKVIIFPLMSSLAAACLLVVVWLVVSQVEPSNEVSSEANSAMVQGLDSFEGVLQLNGEEAESIVLNQHVQTADKPAVLQFQNGASEVQISAHSDIHFSEDDGHLALNINTGSITARIAEQADRALLFKTSLACVEVLGTEFVMMHNEQETEVIMLDGSVQVKNPHTNEEIKLKKRQHVFVRKDGRMQPWITMDREQRLLAASSAEVLSGDDGAIDVHYWVQRTSAESETEAETGKLPLIIFLHDFRNHKQGVDHGLLREASLLDILQRKYYSDKYPAILCAIQCPKALRWSEDAIQHSLHDIIATVLQSYNGDKDRVSMYGIGMGAKGCVQYLQNYPGELAAAVPLMMMRRDLNDSGLANENIYFFDWPNFEAGGEINETFLRHNRQGYEFLAGHSSTILFHELPAGIYHPWEVVFTDETVIDWMFAQRAPGNP